tara:strand:+ start:2376 stop:2498 length:123 start_codon:yes stop_codon:yes gene_type:complete
MLTPEQKTLPKFLQEKIMKAKMKKKSKSKMMAMKKKLGKK